MGLYYIAHRLFSAHDRALGAYVARRLARQVGPDAVFLPFCDTDEEELDDACKGRRLFELDRERLHRIDGMLALLHGPSLDDGVCMEIGYAAALGVPVVALTTDFQTYGRTSNGPALAFPDPLLDVVLTDVIRVDRLGPPPARPVDRFETFLRRNLHPLRAATDQAVMALLDAQPRATAGQATGAGQPRAFVEPSPYLSRELWQEVTALLAGRGWDVCCATRFGDLADPRQAAQDDWEAAGSATLTLVDISGPESPPGAALLVGAGAAAEQTVLAAESGGWWTFADGREPNWRNLMIQYGVTGRFAKASELTALALPGQ